MQQMQQGRDVFNEKVGAEADEQAEASKGGMAKALPDRVIIYTSYGEIHC